MAWPSVTTTVDSAFIVLVCGQDTDANNSATLSLPVNANLTGLTEQFDQTVNTGAGGGIVFLTGTKDVAGSIGSTTATGSTSVSHTYLTMALTPMFMIDISITGVASSILINSISGINETYAISTVQSISGIGAIVASQSINISLIGNASTYSVGNLSPPEFTLFLNGNSLTTSSSSIGSCPSVIRPSVDIIKNGWYPSSGSVLVDMIDENTFTDSDYITTPNLVGSSIPTIMSLSSPLPIGTYTIKIRGQKTGDTSSFIISLLDDANSVVGMSLSTSLTNSFVLYTIDITTSAVSTRVQIEAI